MSGGCTVPSPHPQCQSRGWRRTARKSKTICQYFSKWHQGRCPLPSLMDLLARCQESAVSRLECSLRGRLVSHRIGWSPPRIEKGNSQWYPIPAATHLWIFPDALHLSSLGWISVTWNKNSLDPKILFPVSGVPRFAHMALPVRQDVLFVCRIVEGQQCLRLSIMTSFSFSVSASLFIPQALFLGTTTASMYIYLPQDQEQPQSKDHV